MGDVEYLARVYLITGGAGFIGSHFAEALLERGDRVVVLDDLSTGRVANLARPRAPSELRARRRLRARRAQGRRTRAPVRRRRPPRRRGRREAHRRAAAPLVHHQHSRLRDRHRGRAPLPPKDPGRQHVGDLRQERCRTRSTRPPTASRRPSVARWAYSTAKAVDEILASRLPPGARSRSRSSSACSTPSVHARARPTGWSSPGSSARRLPASRSRSSATAARPGASATSSTSSTRSSGSSTADAVGEVFNVGSSEEITILELAHRILRRTEKLVRGSSWVPYEEAYADGFEDMRRRVPDTTKIEALMGWRPRHTLDDILADAIADAHDEPSRDAASDVYDLTDDRSWLTTAGVGAQPTL